MNGQPNKALHQTRRGGAAASRPVVEARLAGERRCSTYLEVRAHLNGRTIAVGARSGQMEPKKYFSAEKDPDPNQGEVP